MDQSLTILELATFLLVMGVDGIFSDHFIIHLYTTLLKYDNCFNFSPFKKPSMNASQTSVERYVILTAFNTEEGDIGRTAELIISCDTRSLDDVDNRREGCTIWTGTKKTIWR